MYSYARFFTMTGWHLLGTPTTIEARQEALTALHLTVFGPYVGDTVWCLNTHGDITNAELVTIATITESPEGQLYATFVETTTGWPLAQCDARWPRARARARSFSPMTPSSPRPAPLRIAPSSPGCGTAIPPCTTVTTPPLTWPSPSIGVLDPGP